MKGKVNSIRKSVLLKRKQDADYKQVVRVRRAAPFVPNERGFRYRDGEKVAR